MSIQSIVILGSGNVATVLGKALKEAGLNISCIYSRNINHAKLLGGVLQAAYTSQANDVPSDANLYILAVKDEAIETISQQLNVKGLVIHVSGNTSMAVLKKHKRSGVLYALQTFNKNTDPDFSKIPFLVEALSAEDEGLLSELAHKLSSNVVPATSEQRQALHVAAVFANNFTNHLFVIARQIMDNNGLPFGLLQPLIQQTVKNALTNNSAAMQTGPAIRFDHQTIQSHLMLLKENPDAEKIYRLITESIQKFHPEKA